ncbi:hypothetical protein V1264_010044 [Littorina saxatilis]
MKGMRDKDGNPLPNAHLQGLFSRVCKLLFYRIRPVFVFDGGVPALKKKTLAARRERKENIDKEKGHTSQKILQNLLKSHAVKGVTGDRTEHISLPAKPGAEADIYQLPPLPEVDKGSKDPVENGAAWEWEAEEDLFDHHRNLVHSYQDDFQNLDDIDFDSKEFKSLPAEIRHEILMEMKEQRRENALARIAIMPEESKDFSDYQLKKLIKQSRLTGKIESLRKEMNQQVSGDITYALGDDYYGEVVEAQRVVSEDAAHYILIKGLTRKQQDAEAERYKARKLLKEERESERNLDKKKMVLETVEEEIPDEELVANVDEWEKSVVDEQTAAGGKIVSDDEMSDEDKGKSRRERRGKSLMTRSGLRSVAKKGRGRKTSARRPVISDNEEDEDIVDVSEETKTSTSSITDCIKKEPCEETEITELISKDSSCNNNDLHNKDEEGNGQNRPSDFKIEKTDSPLTDEKEGYHSTDDRCKLLESRSTDSGNSHSPDEGKTDFAEEERELAETRNRLLTEEEDLLKAKEEKMAALMKSLEKRTQVTKSSLAERKPSVEEPSVDDTREKLIHQEEELMKEKEAKMAALLKSLERRKQLQSKSNPMAVNSDERTNSEFVPERRENARNCDPDKLDSEDETQKPEAGQDSRGFLEDVVELEKRTVLRKSKRQQLKNASSSEPKSSSSLSSTKSSAFPSLTVNYLEDVESMLEPDSNGTAESNKAHAETNMNNTSETREKTQPNLATKNTKDFDTEEVEETKFFSRTKVMEKSEGCKNPEGIFVTADSVLAKESASSLRAPKRKPTGKLEEQTVEKKVNTAPPPVIAAQNEEEDSEDEGFMEITIDPSRAPDDDLFPASMFVTGTDAIGTKQPQSTRFTPLEAKGSSDENEDGEDDEEDNKIDQTDGEESASDDERVHSPDINQEAGIEVDSDVPQSGSKITRSRSEEAADPIKESHGNGSTRIVRHESFNSEVSIPSFGEESEAGTEPRDVSVEFAKDEEIRNFTKGVNSLGDLYDLQRGLAAERQALTSEMGRQARLGKSITEQINLEAQELLQLFGVPYVVSPMEAESQCAQLELLGLAQGTITDDSDSWLFGASNIYKNFFNQSKYVEYYSANAIYQRFCLDRRKLINIALLCGSDYTPGIAGVGPVRAMEVLAEFPGDGLEGLRAFREWWEDAKDGILPRNQGKVRNKLRNLELHEGFPSRQVVEAYLHPSVDESEDGFTWRMPDVERLQQYAKKKFGWTRQKADEALEPMMKELTKKMTQGRIHSYFQPENFLPPKQVQSKRLQAALDKFQGRGDSESESESESASQSESEESDPPLPELGESVIDKANQILSGSTRGRGRGSRGRGGKRGGKSAGQEVKVQGGRGRGGGQDPQQREVVGQRGRGGKPQAKVQKQTRKGSKSETEKSPVRTQRVRGRGRGAAHIPTAVSRPAQPRQALLRDEVSLSESSSSDEDSDEPQTKKQKIHQGRPVSHPHTKQDSGSVAAKSTVAKQKGLTPLTTTKSIKKKPGGPNVKKVAPAKYRPAPAKQKAKGEVFSCGAKALSATGDQAALRDALGGDLDPTTMTLDDLGSDFSDD